MKTTVEKYISILQDLSDQKQTMFIVAWTASEIIEEANEMSLACSREQTEMILDDLQDLDNNDNGVTWQDVREAIRKNCGDEEDGLEQEINSNNFRR